MRTPPSPLALRRLAAALEVFGIYFAGSLISGWLAQALGLERVNPLATFHVHISDAELLTAARQFAVLLALQYGGFFLLILPLNAWHRRRGAAAYGLTRAGRSWTALALAGLATVALAYWPVLGSSIANTVHHWGETVPWRQALFDTSWRRWEFWLFMGVASWGASALLEELFFRGYCQRRLAEDWGDGPAIAGIACLFVFAHSHYFKLDAYHVSTVLGVAALAAGLGTVFAVTRSLLPGVIAHMLINVPTTLPWQIATFAVCLIAAALLWRRGWSWVRQAFTGASGRSCLALGVVGAGWAMAAGRVDALPQVALGLVACAAALHAVERRRKI